MNVIDEDLKPDFHPAQLGLQSHCAQFPLFDPLKNEIQVSPIVPNGQRYTEV